MTRLAGLFGLLLALLLAPAAWAQSPPTFPELTGRVVDDAHVLSPQTQAELTEKLADLEHRTSRQLVVVTLPSLQGQEIADYGYQLLRHWGIGQKGLNNGAILIVAPSDHKVRVEVGYGLEPILTDALSSVILQERVLPRFRAGDVEGGVVAGTDALIEQLSADTSTAEQNVANAEHQRAHVYRRGSGIGGIIPLIVLFFIFSAVFGGRRRGGGLGWFLPLMFLSSSSRGGWGGRDDGWGGGGGGGWGGGDGGGFSGGGGSGGGGGASGSW